MRRAFILLATTTLVLGAASFTFASASNTKSRAHDQSRVLKLRAIDVASQFIDLGAEGYSQGDQNVFTSDLFAEGRRVGYDGGTCTVVRVNDDGSSVLQCLGTNRLRGGQISVQGFVDISAEGALQPFKLGITGGTQRYHKAHGQVVGNPISETELDLRFHIR